MPTIPFTSDPAGVTLGEGLSVSARYWRATVDLWSLPVALVAAVTAVVSWMIGGLGPAAGTLPTTYAPGTDPMTVIGPYLPGLLASTFVTGTVSMVAGWVYLSIAIAGLRGYRVMPGWIIRRGLRTFAADILLTLGFGAVFAILAVVSLAGGPGLVLVVMASAFVPAIYLSVRLIFWSLAIFDGAGIRQGLGATWLLSRGAVARLLGWGLTVATIGLLVNVVASTVTLPLGDGNPVRNGITAAATEAFAAYSMIALGVIYESQRRRSVLRSPYRRLARAPRRRRWTPPHPRTRRTPSTRRLRHPAGARPPLPPVTSPRARPAPRCPGRPRPSASTSADATMTPSAPAVAIARTWAGFETPNPTATGTGETAFTSRTSLATVGGSEVRAPVTPTSETQ